VNKSLSAEDRASLLKDAYQMIAWSRDAVHLIKGLFEQNLEHYNAFGRFSAHSMGLIRTDGAMDLYHGGLRARRADGTTLFDHFDYGNYLDVVVEDVKSWSYMKFPFFRSMGNSDEGWYRVGPLARVNNCDFIPTPLADKERRDFVAFDNGSATGSTLGYHWARMIEMLHAAEVIKDLLHDDDICGTELMATGKRQERGVGVIEAPRGTLIHDYSVDENDQVTHANLIVSTTHNNQAMNESIRVVAKQYLDGKEITEGLLNHIEVAIRCFDPCLSCATHALGQMPLEVTLIDAGGTVLDTRARHLGGDVCSA
jgi:NAD-reducing hydrogenase large subunit